MCGHIGIHIFSQFHPITGKEVAFLALLLPFGTALICRGKAMFHIKCTQQETTANPMNFLTTSVGLCQPNIEEQPTFPEHGCWW